MTIEPISIVALWGDRPESRDECAVRASALLSALTEHFADVGHWMVPGKRGRPPHVRIDTADISAVSRNLRQNKGDFGGYIEQLGWSGSFLMDDAERHVRLRLRCGSWSLGNIVDMQISRSLAEDVGRLEGIVKALVDTCDLAQVTVYGWPAKRRFVALKQFQMPIVETMVYVANNLIEPKAFPGVHRVEHYRGGTFVILRARLSHVDDVADLSLIEEVEAVFKQHMPPPLPEPTIRHNSQQ